MGPRRLATYVTCPPINQSAADVKLGLKHRAQKSHEEQPTPPTFSCQVDPLRCQSKYSLLLESTIAAVSAQSDKHECRNYILLECFMGIISWNLHLFPINIWQMSGVIGYPAIVLHPSRSQVIYFNFALCATCLSLPAIPSCSSQEIHHFS